MAYPDKYTRGYGFASYQESHPQSPLPGSQVDVEFDAAAKSTAAITAFLQKFARSDGRLANGSVGVDQLAPDLTIGFKAPTTWEPSVLYSLGATVFYLSGFYNCTTAHTSGSNFNPDYWGLILDFGSSANAAAASASTATTQAGNAASSAASAATSEANAATSESNAATSETNAATSASTATTKAGVATTQAGTATTQAGIATAAAASVVQFSISTTAALLSAYGPAVILTDGSLYITGARDVSGDGGGSTFRYLSTDTTTSDNGGSVRVDGQGRRFIAVGPIIDPRVFGVKGDASTDDTAAWNEFISYCTASKTPPRCPVQIESKITDTISYTPNVISNGGSTGIDLGNVTFLYAGTRDRPAIEIGALASQIEEASFVLPSVIANGNVAWDIGTLKATTQSNDVGIRIHRTYRVSFVENYVSGFTKGIEYVGCSYSVITGKHINDCKHGRVYNSEGSNHDNSFTNENVVIGGRIGTSSNSNGLSDAAGQTFTWDHSSSYRGQNCNKFYGVCFEMASGTGSYRVPVYHDGAGCANRFHDSRHESGQGPHALCDGGGYSTNSVFGNDYGVLYAQGSTGQYNRVVQVNGACGNLWKGPDYVEHTWHSGDLIKHVYPDGSTGGYLTHPEVFIWDAVGNAASRNIPTGGYIQAHRTGVNIADFGPAIGVAVDTTRMKNFRVCASLQDIFTGRLTVFAFDSTGAALTGNATDATWGDEPYVKGSDRQNGNQQLFANSSNRYSASVDGRANALMYLTVREEVAYIIVSYMVGANPLVINSMEIAGFSSLNTSANPFPAGDGLTGMRVYSLADDGSAIPLASAKPDSSGVVGYFARGARVGKSNVNSGDPAGYVCSGAGWLSAAWAASTAYPILGTIRTNDSGKQYQLSQAGTSASSGGPTGTSSPITDGTCKWSYIGTKAVFVSEAVTS